MAKKKITKRQLLLKRNMKAFPKIELHRHLEGSFHQETLYEIAQKNNLNTPDKFSAFKKRFQFPKDSGPDFLKFLSMFKNDWYRSHNDIYKITYESVKQLAQDGIYYIELRFSPEHFALYNDFKRTEVTPLIIQAADQAAKEADFHIRYLLTFNRSKQTAEEMIELYHNLKKLDLSRVVGIDLAGDESNYPPEWFTPFFDLIAEDDLFKATIHAGEVSPPDQIWTAIEKLKAARIGHGTSTIKDERLQEFLKKKDIALEQCITSNFQTGSWPDEKNHPLGRLFKNDVPVTINSDDPSIQNTDLTDDYIKAVKFFDFDHEDLLKLNLTALRSSFLSPQDKKRITNDYMNRYDAWVESVSRET